MDQKSPNDGRITLLRILAGFLAFAGLTSIITSAILFWNDFHSLSITSAWVLFVLAPYGAYLFGYFSFTGRLPMRFEKNKPQTSKTL